MPTRNQSRPASAQAARNHLSAPTRGEEDLMEAMIAACAMVAYADGTADLAERRKLFGLMRANPVFAGFSSDDLVEEFAAHGRIFEIDPIEARRRALRIVRAARASPAEIRIVLRACQAVLEADGVAHPREYEAIGDIGAALGTD